MLIGHTKDKTPCAFRMTIFNFIMGCFTNVFNLNPETQSHSSQRMVTIKNHLIVSDISDGINQSIVIAIIGLCSQVSFFSTLFNLSFRNAFKLHTHF